MSRIWRLRPGVLNTAMRISGIHSDRELADLLGVSTTTIGRLRRESTSPSVAVLMRLREATGMTPDELLVETAA